MSSFDWGGGGAASVPDASSSTKGSIKLTNNLSGTADSPEVIDLTITGEQLGSILYHNGTDWVQLSPGTSGQYLVTNGPSNNPGWENLSVNSGTSTIDFGSAPGGNYASVAVTGQTGISSTSSIKVWIQESSTVDHNGFEHLMLNMASGISFGNIVNNVGFTIYILTELRVNGQFLVNWEWI